VSNVSIVPADLAIKAMQDAGYKNAAYAIAEIIDNSVQADSKKVDLLCSEEYLDINGRQYSRINELAIVDNGCGMDKEVLQQALQFGNGTRLQPKNQKGIGKFGMGLPSASISQAKIVEVWSWQDGIKNANFTYLNVNEIISKKQQFIPEPIHKEIPKKWIDLMDPEISKNNSGTLVVWKKMDRCIWKTGDAIINNSEFLIGRMYRYFLYKDKLKIRMLVENGAGELKERFAKANDPLYLQTDTSTPKPFDKKSMFEQYGENYINQININGEKVEVVIKASIVKKETLKVDLAGDSPGNSEAGKHAKKNIGISIVRAGRELDLDKTLTTNADTERWWGIEISFPPQLDEIFGVTNNKQAATNLTELFQLDFSDLPDGQNYTQYREELKASGDPKYQLVEIVQILQRLVKEIRGGYRNRSEGLRSGSSGESGGGAEKKASDRTKKRKEKGFEGGSDRVDIPVDEQNKELINYFRSKGFDDDEVEAYLNFVNKTDSKYILISAPTGSPDFFSSMGLKGKLNITLNSEHPAFNALSILDKNPDEIKDEDLRKTLVQAIYGLKLIFFAWARYEDENEDVKDMLQKIRIDWGTIAKDFFSDE